MVNTQVGYALKQAQALLHARMEEALAPLGLTVSQYSCLHSLRREPGISAAALARATFVTRQSMNALLQQLIDRGLVDRPAQAETGRALPAVLTAAGGSALDSAQVLVDAVQERMLGDLTPAETAALERALGACIRSLG
ncbi:DNA-binding MarR family transcriptional regulator [Microbacteriaceae bacterium SG_E_30_P1]|uniref:DNA-binding MarR family transcriptional regulator n=1 Tax=Antiquaquibacter oligotrophicus TaxID=2880260 RepID=A0ABT6KRM1_9MICO|nr:MarR family transcriptional regulator [Antiquaquibacter oligotrophicus]MDH6182615.1 DNA-binding MarR family transcriptional regulator [Antiquaquibacter oligotrophicus]UDF14420.1 MarR family transcriptional regulator [Antiquaquibacter oligotrophicus]